MNRTYGRKLHAAILAAAILMGVRFAASAQQAAPIPLDLTGVKPQSAFGGMELPYLDKHGSATAPTARCVETLPGNGTRAGYMLSHGGIVPSSVRVSVGARSLRSGVDYGLDYASGMLVFTEAVRRFETITISYDYVQQADAARSMVPTSGLALNLKGTSLNFGYGVSSFNGLDFNSYGLAMNSKLGKSGTLSGLVYFSTPSASNLNVVGRTDATRASAVKRDARQARSDHLVAQELNARLGSATVRATYQDVGASFGGFQAMRQANANNAELINQINTLERERGIRRLGFGTDLVVGKDGKLGFDWGRTSDGKGDISRQSLSLSTKALSFSYSDLDIGRTFEGFKQLREGAAPQWARERGMRRTDMALSLTPGKDSKFDFGQTSLRDPSGVLARQSLTLGTKTLGFTYSRRSVDATFGRLNDLSDAEKSELALEIRRQFNPNATAGEVTPQERQQIAGEAGIERARLGFTANLRQGGSFALNQFTVSDGSGTIRRNALSLTGRGYQLSYMDQSIDRDFSRLGSLNQFERAQYGNELGVRRNALDFAMALNKHSNLAYSQSSIRDDAGGMTRQSISFAGKGVNAVLNLASTDSSFARARDLVGLNDQQKAAIEAERGFRRMDFAANVTAFKGLSLQTYTYNAVNSEQGVSLNRFRHFAEWTPGRASRVTYLTEGQSSATAGSVTNGVQHSLLTLDQQFSRGMKLNAFADTVATTNGGSSNTVTTHFVHFETDRSKANNLMAETKRVRSTTGSFENTTQLDLNYRASRSMTFRLNHLAVDRGSDSSATTNTLTMNWQVRKNLQFSGSYALTDTNNGQDAVAKSFSLGGELIRNFNLTGTYSEAGVVGKPRRAASDISISNAKPFSFLGLTNTTLAFKYTSLNDQGRQVSEGVSGVLKANLGKNVLAFEYGGSLDPKNNSAVSRMVSFVSDRNEKLPIHFDITYKARNINRGDVQLIRNYNLSLRLDKQTDIRYSYVSLPEANGQIRPLMNSTFSLKRTLNSVSSFALDYSTNRDYAKRTQVRKLGALFQTKVNKLAAVQVGYSVDISNLNGQNTNGHTVSLNFDRRVSTDNVLAFGAAYTMNQNGQADDVRGTVEFRTRF